MRRNTYVRLTYYRRPPRKIAVPLARFAKVGNAAVVLEGCLLDDVRCREGIRIRADYRNGVPTHEGLTTSPVVLIEDSYALTDHHIVQFVRIPPPWKMQAPSDGSLEEKGITRQGPRFLTASQSASLKELVSMAELCGDEGTYGGVQVRVRPLISGFSGSGKTALVGHLCDYLAAKSGVACPLLKISAGSWILFGARHAPHTLNVIRDFVRKHANSDDQRGNLEHQGARAVILIDEIDKITSRRGMSDAWYRSVVSEAISFADGDSRLAACGWSNADIAGLRSVLVIGAGAFLDGLEQATDQDTNSHLAAIANHCAIPDEVRLRFNSRILYVEPPNAQDYRDAFRRLYQDLGLPLPSPGKLDNLIAAAEEAKAGMRFVEQHVSDLLIAYPHLRRGQLRGPKLTVSADEPEKKSNLEFVSRSRLNELIDQLYEQTQALEAPLVHVQALFRIHEGQFSKVRGDVIDPATKAAITASNLHTDFTSLLGGLRYYYAVEDKEFDQCNTDLWLAGHRVQAAVWGAIILEQQFLLEERYLALFTEVFARLSRLLKAVKHFSTVSEEGTE